ncbi:MAG: flavin oxidoreductase [Spirochaetaceae bacterium]|nr:MAG: flavin oxidoreductase [Spirochaetaceae bacterium]
MRSVYTREAIEQMEKVPRLNLVNSCVGYKSANLIATRNLDGKTNLAMFGSVLHLGSNPPLLGFIQRPISTPRDTYTNIKEFGWFTVNHVSTSMIKDAHHTSAHYDPDQSEFDYTALEEEYVEGVEVPFVAESPIQVLCRFENEYPIQENGTVLIVAAIEMIRVDFGLMGEDGWLRLDKGAVVAVNGLDGYALPRLLNRFSYARPGETSESLLTHNGKNGDDLPRQIADSETAS